MNSTERDLVERLRDKHFLDDENKARLPEPAADIIYLFRLERAEAADALASIRAERDAAVAALKPFAAEADRIDPNGPDPTVGDSCEIWQVGGYPINQSKITYGNLRAARAIAGEQKNDA